MLMQGFNLTNPFYLLHKQNYSLIGGTYLFIIVQIVAIQFSGTFRANTMAEFSF